MAQVTGDSSYDWDGHHKWEAALRSLRELANAWALGESITAAEGAAVVIRRLRVPASGLFQTPAAEPLRLQLTRIQPLEAELSALCPKASQDDLAVAATALREILEKTREAWEDTPLKPDEMTVLQEMTGLLFERGLLGTPPRKGTW